MVDTHASCQRSRCIDRPSSESSGNLQQGGRRRHLCGCDRDVGNNVTSGSGQTFSEFFRAEQAAAAQLALLLTGDRAAAEDVAQDAFTGLYARFDTIQQPRAYLRKSITNGVRARARAQGRRSLREQLVATGASTTSPEPVDPLIDVLNELPYKQRAVLVLRYWADAPDAEIADLLDLRPGSVRSLAHRGLKQLERKLP